MILGISRASFNLSRSQDKERERICRKHPKLYWGKRPYPYLETPLHHPPFTMSSVHSVTTSGSSPFPANMIPVDLYDGDDEQVPSSAPSIPFRTFLGFHVLVLFTFQTPLAHQCSFASAASARGLNPYRHMTPLTVSRHFSLRGTSTISYAPLFPRVC